MDHCDDIVIGSGLAALGCVLGLPATRRVLVLGGQAQGAFAHYDGQGAVPCAYSGLGGLGGYWHGVIPVSLRQHFTGGRFGEEAARQTFVSLFQRFYPRVPITQWAGRPALFVPWKPIRPAHELARLAASRPAGSLVVREAVATGIQRMSRRGEGVGMRVLSTAGEHTAPRIWVAAGAVHTPALLAASFGPGVRRDHVSDHVLCYVGQTDQAPAPRTHRTADGVFFPGFHDEADTALYTLRPARFAFRQLDHGIEQRAAFGLPTGNAVSKIMRSMSPGLLAEAFYNRFGLFAKAPRYSIYAQTRVDRAYALGEGGTPLAADRTAIQAAGDRARARARQPFAGAVLSRRPDLHIPGIHLHHSLDMDGLRAAGLNGPGDAVQVVDASALEDIGPEHHSFRMLCAAYLRAQAS